MESVLPRGRVVPNYMRNPAIRVLLAVLLAAVLLAGAGVAATGDTPSSSLSEPTQTPTAPTSGPGTALTAGSSGSASLSGASVGVGPSPQVDTTFEPAAETRMRIDLQPDRDAVWEVAVRYEFSDPNQTVPFEAVGERFLDGEVGPDPALFEGFATEASRNVDRRMTITDVDREVVVIEDPAEMDLDNETDGEPPAAVGELRLTFVWTEFLDADGENLQLGDALTTPDDGTWLRSLEADQRIELMTPQGYTVSGTPGAAVPLRDNAVIIEGPRVFEGDDRVVVVYSPTETGTDGTTPPWTLLAGAIVLGALLVAAGLVGYRRVGPVESGGEPGDPSTAAPQNGQGENTPGRTTRSDPHENDGDGTNDEGATEDLSLLSDEERVERILERNGGRMRQAEIVAETGWSDAKVSQLLSAMADEGRVEKLRLGRENLISLPDDEDGKEE